MNKSTFENPVKVKINKPKISIAVAVTIAMSAAMLGAGYYVGYGHGSNDSYSLGVLGGVVATSKRFSDNETQKNEMIAKSLAFLRMEAADNKPTLEWLYAMSRRDSIQALPGVKEEKALILDALCKAQDTPFTWLVKTIYVTGSPEKDCFQKPVTS